MEDFKVKCETVVNIITTWPSVTRNDIPRIRDIVANKYFAEGCVSDVGILNKLGDVFQEMMALHVYINDGVVGDRSKLSDDEFWYITEWLQNNRLNYKWKTRRLYDYETLSLSRMFSDGIYWIIGEIKKGSDPFNEFMEQVVEKRYST